VGLDLRLSGSGVHPSGRHLRQDGWVDFSERDRQCGVPDRGLRVDVSHGFGVFGDVSAQRREGGAALVPEAWQSVRHPCQPHEGDAQSCLGVQCLRNHILPRFGEMALGDVNRLAVKAWVKSLRRSLAESTAKDVVTLLSMILGEAVDEALIGANPCRLVARQY
jgi:hypothetical protein